MSDVQPHPLKLIAHLTLNTHKSTSIIPRLTKTGRWKENKEKRRKQKDGTMKEEEKGRL
jgi:hypothetical protein